MQMLTARDVAEMLKISYEQSLRLMRHPDLKSKKSAGSTVYQKRRWKLF